jgi:hypothetical protein
MVYAFIAISIKCMPIECNAFIEVDKKENIMFNSNNIYELKNYIMYDWKEVILWMWGYVYMNRSYLCIWF